MLMVSEPSFWGEVFPSYLGAVGGIASALVAALAFLLGLRTKRSVASVKKSLEPIPGAEFEPSPQPTETDPLPQTREGEDLAGEGSGADDGGIGETVAHGYLAGRNPPASEPWSVMRELRADANHDLAIANASDRVLNLIGIELFNGTDWVPSLLPKASEVSPGEARYFNFKALGGRGSNINVVQLVWIDPDGTIRNQRVLL